MAESELAEHEGGNSISGPLNPTANVLQAIPDQNPVRRAIGNKTSRRDAINAFRAQCMGCDEDYLEPGFRTEIRNCTSRKCALWHFRPYQVKV